MSALHDDEIPVTIDTVRALLRAQRPDLADEPIRFVGGGTDNTMYRIGDDLLARLPRTPGKAAALGKELAWLPRLAGPLGASGVRVPEPLHAGDPSGDFPLPWAIYGWLEGEALDPAALDDAQATALGEDLARFVTTLQALPAPSDPDPDLRGYRARPLAEVSGWAERVFAAVRELPTGLDLDALERIWQEGLDTPPATGHVLLHTDLRPGNLLTRDGRLSAVIDFGGISVGLPDGEHAPIWDLPPAARETYWSAVAIDDDTWLRARSLALFVALSGVSYYWTTFPAFVAECRARIDAIATHDRAQMSSEKRM